MFKKSVSFLLLGFMLLTSIPFSVAFAQNDSWGMEPAVRFVTDLSHAEVWVGFKGTLTGTWFLDPSRVGTFLLHYYVPLNGK